MIIQDSSRNEGHDNNSSSARGDAEDNMPQTPVLEKKWRRAVASIVHDVRGGGERQSHVSNLHANLLAAHANETSRDSDTSKKSGKSSKTGANKSKKAGGSTKERKKLVSQQVQWTGPSNIHTDAENAYVQRTATFDQSAHRPGVHTHQESTQNSATVNASARPYHHDNIGHEYGNSASHDHAEELDVLRARLRRMGVSEAQINACAGRAELRALIDIASGSYDINLSPLAEAVRCALMLFVPVCMYV
jgi:hypothetical protein